MNGGVVEWMKSTLKWHGHTKIMNAERSMKEIFRSESLCREKRKRLLVVLHKLM